MKMYVLVFVLLALSSLCLAQEAACRVEVKPEIRYQIIYGWGKLTPWYLPAHPLQRDQCIEAAVNDFGINRLRFEGLCGNAQDRRSWEWLNDNDPTVINWNGFNTTQLDAKVTEWVVPWKKAVEARGEPFNLYVSPSFYYGGSSGNLPFWMERDPREYAEWMTATLLRLRDTHGITADYVSICNEAGHNNAFTPQVTLTMMKALMP